MNTLLWYAIAIYLSIELWQGLKNGRALSLFRFVKRSESPFWFWTVTILNIVLAVCAFVVATMSLKS